MIKRLLMVLTLIGCTLAPLGCARVSRTRFKSVYTGMPTEQVEDLLGRPQQVAGNRWVYMRDWPYHRGEIIFQEGRVL